VSALIENSEPPKERKLRGFGASRSTGRTFRGIPGSTSCDSGESTRAYFDSSKCDIYQPFVNYNSKIQQRLC